MPLSTEILACMVIILSEYWQHLSVGVACPHFLLCTVLLPAEVILQMFAPLDSMHTLELAILTSPSDRMDAL